MFKSLLMFFSATDHEPADAAYEGNILAVLDQQFLDRTAIVGAARRMVALAMAQQHQEKERFEAVSHGIADLEARARWALDDGDEVLAHQAAEVIASLESERNAARRAMQSFDRETRRLNAIVRTAEARVLELKRARRSVKATIGAQRQCLRNYAQDTNDVYALSDEEALLEKLQERQKEIDDAFAELDEMDVQSKPVLITRQLSEDEYDKSIGVAADVVLARLRTPRHTQACSY